MKKGFSLIEIMQTVVLLGIIAGLSVSFFRKLNYDERLYTATEKMLTEAVQEAARQACADDRQGCECVVDGVNTFSSDFVTCAVAEFEYDSNIGYCKKELIESDNVCPDDCFIPQDNQNLCYCTPTCSCGAQLKTYNGEFCENGIPDLSKSVKGYVGVNHVFFADKLLELINHKDQTNAAHDDFFMSVTNTNLFTGVTDESTADDGVQGRITKYKNGSVNVMYRNDNYSMLLPNGVRLYNIGSFTARTDADNDSIIIVIKYDRLESLQSAEWGKNIRAIKYKKDGTKVAEYPAR